MYIDAYWDRLRVQTLSGAKEEEKKRCHHQASKKKVSSQQGLLISSRRKHPALLNCVVAARDGWNKTVIMTDEME